MKKFFQTTLAILLAVLSFSYATPARAENAEMAAHIKTVIESRLTAEELKTPGNEITVIVNDGEVILTGTVKSIAEKKRAERATRMFEKVSHVDNRLSVSADGRTDQQIADEIARSIRSFAFFDIFDWVEGKVVNGEVVLNGAVREPWRKTDYERLVENVIGARSVTNEIKVLSTSVFDDQLRVQAASLLYGDPLFARYAVRALPPIHIIVDDGRVILKGTVANMLEKQKAEIAVRGGLLAFEVINDLRVERGTEKK